MNVRTAQPAEEWRSVPAFPGYQISSWGSVFSQKTGRELSAAPNKGGYRQVNLRRDGEGHRRYVHQLVATTFVGPRPDGAEVRHLDGDRSNNTVANLVYGTTAENAQDRVRHGRDQNARKTHCKRGHAFDEANTYRFSNARQPHGRACRTCNRAAARRSHERRILRAAGIEAAA